VNRPQVYSVQFEKAEPVQVIVESPTEQAPLFLIPLLVAGILALGLLAIKRARKEFLRGFRKEDQQVIIYLQKHKSVWQNQLQREFSLSRAGTTRLVKRLEERGIITKENFGRTNKIHLK
jgi:uncharacterized membrane protein